MYCSGRGLIEAARCKFQNGDDLLSRQVKPIHYFVDLGSGLQILEHLEKPARAYP